MNKGILPQFCLLSRVDIVLVWCYNLYMITVKLLDKQGLANAQNMVIAHHYLHKPVDSRSSVEGYAVNHNTLGLIGYLLFGRPEATRCRDWYGSVDDVLEGRREVTRWQVLNLARVWLSPDVQAGGIHCNSVMIPGFIDRKGIWRSTLASTAIKVAMQSIGYDYLVARPPCFLEEPYEISWLLSYCDTRLHRGVIYAQSGFSLYDTGNKFIQTWRIRLPKLSVEQDADVREASRISKRSQTYRASRQQTRMDI